MVRKTPAKARPTKAEFEAAREAMDSKPAADPRPEPAEPGDNPVESGDEKPEQESVANIRPREAVEVERLMKQDGLTFFEAVAVLADKKREETAPPPAPMPRETVEAHLLPRHAEWLKRTARFEAAIRRDATIDPSRMLEIIVREAYAADPSKAGTVDPRSGASGPAGSFNAASGQWDT